MLVQPLATSATAMDAIITTLLPYVSARAEVNSGPSARPNALIAKDQLTVQYDALNCTSKSEKEAIGACLDVRSRSLPHRITFSVGHAQARALGLRYWVRSGALTVVRYVSKKWKKQTMPTMVYFCESDQLSGSRASFVAAGTSDLPAGSSRA